MVPRGYIDTRTEAGSTYRRAREGWLGESVQIAARVFDEEILLVNGFLDMRKLIDLTRKDDLIPTFRTFNTERSYGTKVHVTRECAGKSFFIHGSYNPCVLLAKQFDPDVPQHALPALPAVMLNENEIDDPPPPYETVEQPAAPPRHRPRHRPRHGVFQNMTSGGIGAIGGAAAGGGGGGVGGC